MSDYSQLKSAAEACADLLPLRYMSGSALTYIRNDHGIVFDVHQNRSFPGLMAENKAYADLALAATPEAILGLIEANKQMLGLLAEISQSSGDNWAVMVARNLLKEFGECSEVDPQCSEVLRTQGEADSDECTSCDGSGEYIDAVGDWRGYCSCPAGVAMKNKTANKDSSHEQI